MPQRNGDLDRLFYPRSIAVVDFSSGQDGIVPSGNTYLEGSIKMNFSGRLYPVNPHIKNILGIKAFRNVKEIPDNIDLAIFTIPSSVTLPVMKDCTRKKVKFVHLFAAGFSEICRAENITLEKDILKLACKGGIRIIGPNCLGIYCPEGGLAWSGELPRQSGPFGFISQSGQLADQIIQEGRNEGIFFNKVVSFGNSGDLQCDDFLRYFANDEKIKIIGVYLEGMKNGQAFFEIVRKLSRIKSLVIWKGGQTEGGSRAAQCHTAAIAGSPKVWEGLCRQSGIISVFSTEEMISTLSALQKMSLPHGINVAIVGGAGGGSVTMTDIAEKEGLKVPQLSETTIRQLETFVPLQGSSVQNPLDLMPAFFDVNNFTKLSRLLRDDPKIDALIFSLRLDLVVKIFGAAFINLFLKITTDAVEELKKPLLISIEKAESLEEELYRELVLERYSNAGMMTFSSFSVAARVLYNLHQHYNYLSSLQQ